MINLKSTHGNTTIYETPKSKLTLLRLWWHRHSLVYRSICRCCHQDAAFSGWSLVGIVSWGIGCARTGIYGVYAEVNRFEQYLGMCNLLGSGVTFHPLDSWPLQPEVPRGLPGVQRTAGLRLPAGDSSNNDLLRLVYTWNMHILTNYKIMLELCYVHLFRIRGGCSIWQDITRHINFVFTFHPPQPPTSPLHHPFCFIQHHYKVEGSSSKELNCGHVFHVLTQPR